MRHGAHSERRVGSASANHRRRLLRQLGLRVGDLDPLARGYLDQYVTPRAKLDLLDAYFEEHGLLKPSGEAHGATRFYVSLANSARLSLGRFEEHLRFRKRDATDELRAHVARTYGTDA